MRVPLSWLREYVDLPTGETGRDMQAKLIRAGLEVEAVEQLGADLKGPLVVGQVLAIEELTDFKKPIRYCQVDVGDANGTGEPQNIVCGARNFAVGDKVVVVLPGAVLPGPFPIAARQTYGKTSEGMICSARELGMGDDHDGIIVLPPEYEPGTDAIELLELVDEVLDIAVTADRGYCLSLRGVARETAIAYGLPLRDPALIDVPPANSYGPLVKVEDQTGCDRFVARSVVGVDPAAKSPIWMQRRIQKAGMRPISLAVDITNYVMMEMGQPLHAYDRHRVDGAITVRRATAGEKLRTLDGVERTLDAEDLLICDNAGPIGIAGVMGGAGTEIAAPVVDPETGEVTGTSEIVIEAAHFAPVSIARSARRHKLPSEAAKRFERGVDPEATRAAAQRAVDLLVLVAGGTAEAGVTDVVAPHPVRTISITADLPDRVAGQEYGRETVVRRLQEVGCTVVGTDALVVTPPTWRPDLTDPNDLCEEVIRLEGYENLPSTLPNVPAGRGLTETQRLRRRIGVALASAGQVEVQNYPFIGEAVLDALGVEAGDPRRETVKIANPISHEEPSLRTTLLPGLLGALHRNVGRGTTDVALFELGRVFRVDGTAETLYQAPRLPVDRRPTEDEIAQLDAALPRQPYRVGAVFAGSRDPQGWWGRAQAWTWADAVEAARAVADAAGVELTVRQDQHAPWHPGRCAGLYVCEQLVGHAGELHPRAIKALNLPERTCAMELDLDLLTAGGATKAEGPKISTFPVATQDVALIVDDAVNAADVESALRAGAGELLESLRLFDVYRGESIGEGKKSLAYALRFRAADRTLTADEASAARESAVAEATARVGATLRG